MTDGLLYNSFFLRKYWIYKRKKKQLSFGYSVRDDSERWWKTRERYWHNKIVAKWQMVFWINCIDLNSQFNFFYFVSLRMCVFCAFYFYFVKWIQSRQQQEIKKLVKKIRATVCSVYFEMVNIRSKFRVCLSQSDSKIPKICELEFNFMSNLNVFCFPSCRSCTSLAAIFFIGFKNQILKTNCVVFFYNFFLF